MSEQRPYPPTCTSRACGSFGDACTGCPHKPKLDAFNQWRLENNAVQADPVWSPTIYIAKFGKGE